MPSIEVTDIDVDDMPKLRCPRCQNESAFDIDIEFTIRLARKETWEPMYCLMSDEDQAVCLSCGVTDILRTFKQD